MYVYLIFKISYTVLNSKISNKGKIRNFKMIKIWCSLRNKDKTVKHVTVESEKDDMTAALLDCLEQACRHFDIEMPMWNTKHTKQLNNFRKVSFSQDDFIDKFPYHRFVFEILEAK